MSDPVPKPQVFKDFVVVHLSGSVRKAKWGPKVMPKRSAGDPHRIREWGESLWGNFHGAMHWGFGTRGKSKGEWYGEKAKEAGIMGRIFRGEGLPLAENRKSKNSLNTKRFRL